MFCTLKKAVLLTAVLFLFSFTFSAIAASVSSNGSDSANSKTEAFFSGQNKDTAPKAVTDAGQGIVQVVLSCTDDEGSTYYLHQGTGFLVGARDETQYLVTDRSIITPKAAELEQIRKWSGLDKDAKLTTQIQFLLAPDIVMEASLVSQGSDLPYALLTPAAPLNVSEYLRLGSASEASRKQEVYFWGYDVDSSLLGLTALSASSPSLHRGRITRLEQEPVSISCDAEGENGCTGAPLLDENGCVLGMFYLSEENLEILPADTLKNVLDTLNLPYHSDKPGSDYNVADDKIKQELSDLLLKCQQEVTTKGAHYSKKSLANYKTAISEAMAVTAAPQSTRDDYQSSIDALTLARQRLKPKNFTMRILQLVLLAVLMLFAALNLKQLKKQRHLLHALHPASAPQPCALLRRLDTGETISLDKPRLRMGSADALVDYCITEHSSISRCHATILHQEDGYFLLDNNSTNHTRLNQSVLSPGQTVPLQDGDRIALADVEFQFRHPS